MTYLFKVPKKGLIKAFTICIVVVLCKCDDPVEKEDFSDPEGQSPLDNPGKGNYVVLEEEDVIVLTRETFTHVVFTKPAILVEFYAPWCGHCQQLKPIYERAAKRLKKYNIPLAKVDATKETELAKEYLVTGYPSLMLFRDGVKVEDFEDDRTEDGIVQYMRVKADPDWKPPPSAVSVLTNENFTKVVNNVKLALVMFFAPDCRHCKQMMPEFEKAADVLKDTHQIPLFKIDGTLEKALSDSYSLKGWPSLLVFRHGKEYEYSGRRDQKGIIEYMEDQAKLPSKPIDNYQQLKNMLSRDEATVIGVFDQKSNLFEEFLAAAFSLKEYFKIIHTFEPSIKEKLNLKNDSVIVIVPEIFSSPYEKSQHVFDKKSGTYKEIIDFVSRKSIPLVGLRTKKNIKLKYSKFPLLVVYYDVDFSHQYLADAQFVRKKVVEVAKDYVGSITFAVSNEEEFKDELQALGLDDSGEDVNVGLWHDNGLKFRMEPVEDFGPGDLRDFLKDITQGKLAPHLKSQPIPRSQSSPVKVIVAKSYPEEVMKAKKDVLIEFYAPWCGHCKKLEPLYTKLAKSMALNNPDVIIAKYDASANDVPMGVNVKGFPTIVFLPAFTKEPIYYEGDRSYSSLKDFVNEHSTLFLTEDEKLGKTAATDPKIEL